MRYMTQSGQLVEAVLQSEMLSEALSEATVRAFVAVLKSKLTQHDKKVSSRERMPNIYRLGHLLGAAQRVEATVKGVMDQSTPEALKALEAAMDHEFERGFPPVNAVKKQIAAFLSSGKMPTLKEAKRPTFQAAKEAILDYLQKEGWTVQRNLKVPHATSPKGDLKFWFKTQAVYVSAGKGTALGDASSTWADIRDMSPEAFVKKELEFAARDKPKVNPNMWY